MKKWEKFSDDQLQQFVQESRSFAQLLEKLGYTKESGTAQASVKEMLKIKQIDTSHFTGQGWNKNNYDYSRFQANTNLRSAHALPALVFLRGRKCEKCGLTHWQGQEIPLQVHHIDGNHYNNVIDNLQILCPNCHAQTDTYAGKNKHRTSVTDDLFIKTLRESSSIHEAAKKLGISVGKYAYEKANRLIHENNIKFKTKTKTKTKTKSNSSTKKTIEPNKCKQCGAPISANAQYCIKCNHKNQRKVEWPTREILKEKIYTMSFEAIGREYGVDGNAVRKWCDYYKLPRRKKDIKLYSKEQWNKV